MRSMRSWWCCVLAAALAVGSVVDVRAQGAAAVQFIAVVGDVRIVGRDGAQRAAARGAELRDGETIVTGANGLAQVRFADGGTISVRGNTEVKLDRFAYRGESDRGASLFIALLKGGFRSVTGLIGRLNRDGYKINTPFATIGIRGTVHNPFVQLPAPPGEQTPVAPGAYDYVEQGAVAMQTLQGQTLSIAAQQTGFVSPTGAAQLLPAPPPIFRRDAPRPAPQPAPGAPKTGGAAKPPAGTTGVTPQPGSPALQAPVTQPVQPGPSTIQTMPTAPLQTAPMQTAPTSPILQPGPTLPLQTSPLQTSPMMKPGPIAPMMPPK